MQESAVDFVSEYENSLLALFFKEPLLLAEAQARITEDYFLYTPNKTIYIALCQLTNDPNIKKVDLQLLINKCEKLGLFKSGITPQYVIVLDAGLNMHSSQNYELYLNDLIDCYKKYQTFQALEDSRAFLKQEIAKGSESAKSAEISGRIIQSLDKVIYSDDAQEKLTVSLGNEMESYLEFLSENPQAVKGLRTGFPDLDVAINGLTAGSLTVVAARTGVGKSTFCLNVAERLGVPTKGNNYHTLPILLISTEMSWQEDAARLFAMHSLIKERDIVNGVAFKDESLKPVIQSTLHRIKKATIYHSYMPDFTMEKVCNMITFYKKKYNIQLAIFDYIKVDSEEVNQNQKEHQVLGKFTDMLKQVAGKLQIPVLTACQVGRHGTVADSDKIERYCNNLIYLDQKPLDELQNFDPKEFGSHDLIVAKGRAGGKFTKVPITFYGPCLKMLPATKPPIGETSGEMSEIMGQLISPSKKLYTNTREPRNENPEFDLFDTSSKKPALKIPTAQDDDLF